MKKNIYIIRHGQTEYNKKLIVQGQKIDADLNETGRKQAEDFYQKYKNVPFDRIYTSELKRTHQSVAPFLKKGIKHTILSDLNEMNWGVFEGKPLVGEIYRQVSEIIVRWKNGDYNVKAGEGESPIEALQRMKSAFNTIFNENDDENILVCMHGRVLRILMCHFTGKQLRNMDDFALHNLGLYRIEYDTQTEKVDVKLYCDTSHLLTEK